MNLKININNYIKSLHTNSTLPVTWLGTHAFTPNHVYRMFLNSG